MTTTTASSAALVARLESTGSGCPPAEAKETSGGTGASADLGGGVCGCPSHRRRRAQRHGAPQVLACGRVQGEGGHGHAQGRDTVARALRYRGALGRRPLRCRPPLLLQHTL